MAELSPQDDDSLSERPVINPESDPLAALAAHLQDNDKIDNILVSTYRDIAKEKGVSQSIAEEHVRLLETVPSDLVVDPYGHVPAAFGGAVLNFDINREKAVHDALTGVADVVVAVTTSPIMFGTPSSTALRVVLADHLSLNGIPVSNEMLLRLRSNAAGLGPWWRARSLSLSGCGLGFPQLSTLASPRAQPLVCNLRRLDLSGNKGLGNFGNAPSEGFAAPDVAYLYYLWRHAPLEYVDLSHTALQPRVLAAVLRMMVTYELPSHSGGVGSLVHDGTRSTLQCLKIDAPTEDPDCDGTPEFSAELKRLISTDGPPQLRVLELYGAGIAERDELGSLWAETQRERGHSTVQAAIVRPGVVRFAAGDAVCDMLPIEHIPLTHTVPPPSPTTPSCHSTYGVCEPSGGIDDIELEEQEVEAQLREQLERKLGVSLDDWEPSGFRHKPASHRIDTKESDGPTTILRQTACITKRRRLGGSGGRIGGKQRRGPKSDRRGENISSRHRVSTKSNSSVRMYRGGLVEDELPLGGAEIDLVSEDEGDEYSNEDEIHPEYDEDEDNEFEAGDNTTLFADQRVEAGLHGMVEADDLELRNHASMRSNTTMPEGMMQDRGNKLDENKEPEPFRLRDGALDHDSRLGRKYRSDAKRSVKRIPDALDRKAASRAFKMWDDFAENAWDRHRWDRPSRSQNDLPATLNQLNLLYDILEKYGMSLGMPFPARAPGAGAQAFEDTTLVAPASTNPPTSLRTEDIPGIDIIPLSSNSPPPPPPFSLSLLVMGESQPMHPDASGQNLMEDRTIRRTVLSDSSSLSEREQKEGDDEDVDAIEMETEVEVDGIRNDMDVHQSGGGSSGKRETAAAARELARLAAWGWDSRKEQHPPNKEKYGSVEGKRARSQRFHASQTVLDDTLSFFDDEDGMQWQMKSPGNQTVQRSLKNKKTKKTRAKDIASSPSSTQDDDDDVPLVRLSAFGELMERLGGPNSDDDLGGDPKNDHKKNPDDLDGRTISRNSGKSSKRGLEESVLGAADVAARALLGSLYLPPPIELGIGVQGVVRDSEEDE